MASVLLLIRTFPKTGKNYALEVAKVPQFRNFPSTPLACHPFPRKLQQLDSKAKLKTVDFRQLAMQLFDRLQCTRDALPSVLHPSNRTSKQLRTEK